MNPARVALVDKIALTLAQRVPQTLNVTGFKEAAVLVPIQEKEDGEHLVLTQRTETVNSHRGQVAFPGGKIEPHDASAEAAALRETHEEIGIAAGHVRVLGQLDQIMASSGYIVTPVVGIVPNPYEFRLNPAETAALFSVPLSALLAEGCFKIEPRLHQPERRDPIYHFYYESWDIWGATARIILQLLEFAYGYRMDK
ncbi:MAG TPA: CoA pyrophosphatase [Verrucomicrobiae bacterium]|jgi:8-oxo-dGTP pyrophosphatase MutT (NUDIX family)|nr:CoA pyrophosphatase [Verrucomicrobiae bacterium]